MSAAPERAAVVTDVASVCRPPFDSGYQDSIYRIFKGSGNYMYHNPIPNSPFGIHHKLELLQERSLAPTLASCAKALSGPAAKTYAETGSRRAGAHMRCASSPFA